MNYFYLPIKALASSQENVHAFFSRILLFQPRDVRKLYESHHPLLTRNGLNTLGCKSLNPHNAFPQSSPNEIRTEKV